jgi:peptidoglycan/xylan/chitin deacetylase (PgdA/CDA1 family)
MKNRGVFTLSIDVELAWGVCDKPMGIGTSKALVHEREIIKRLLRLFSKYDVRATWAVVGHLLLAKCDWDEGRVHPEISRPVIKNQSRDWFFQHPMKQDDPLWHGRDIVEWIRNACPRQEIGSHSFCHIPYDETMTERRIVKQDIDRAKELHRTLQLPFEVFIFPRNKVGHRQVLAEAGVRVYRGNTDRWYYSIPCTPIRRLFNFLYFVFPFPPQTVMPIVDENGMTNIPDSMLLADRKGLRRLFLPQVLLRKAIRGLERAVDRREIFHLWFHPANFSYATTGQFDILEEILWRASQLRDSGKLEILPMGKIRSRIIDAEVGMIASGEARPTEMKAALI